MKEQNRIIYLDVLRFIATIFVVLLHISSFYMSENTVGGLVCLVYDAISRWCVPIFVMISGAVFLSPTKNLTIRQLFSKYILRLFCAYVFWGGLYIFVFDPLVPIYHALIHHQSWSYKIILSYPPKYHLWFLPMLIGIYMLIPILKKIVENKKNCVYFLSLWFIFTTCDMLFKCHMPWGELMPKVFYSMKMQLVLGYSGYFVLGLYLASIKINKMLFYGSIGILLLMAIITISGTIIIGNSCLFEYLMPNVIIMSTALFIIIRYVIENRPRIVIPKYIESIGGNLFGVYLIHIFIISLIPPFFAPNGIKSIVLIPFLTITVFFVSLCLINILRKIPYFRYFCT